MRYKLPTPWILIGILVIALIISVLAGFTIHTYIFTGPGMEVLQVLTSFMVGCLIGCGAFIAVIIVTEVR